MSHHDYQGEFLFEVPPRLESASDLVHETIKMAALCGRLALEERTLVSHPGGRAENVAEHSYMLAIVAPVLAEKYYPQLDTNLVARFATVHDVIEAYVGDTPTHNIDDAGLVSKEEREKQGLKKLLHDYKDIPSFAKLVAEYEKQEIPETRHVRVVDKLLPLVVHFLEGGQALREHIDIPGLLKNSEERAQKLRKDYPDFTLLIDAREELALLATKHLF